jgi:hypothetical protein
LNWLATAKKKSNEPCYHTQIFKFNKVPNIYSDSMEHRWEKLCFYAWDLYNDMLLNRKIRESDDHFSNFYWISSKKNSDIWMNGLFLCNINCNSHYTYIQLCLIYNPDSSVYWSVLYMVLILPNHAISLYMAWLHEERSCTLLRWNKWVLKLILFTINLFCLTWKLKVNIL